MEEEVGEVATHTAGQKVKEKIKLITQIPVATAAQVDVLA